MEEENPKPTRTPGSRPPIAPLWDIPDKPRHPDEPGSPPDKPKEPDTPPEEKPESEPEREPAELLAEH